MKLSGYHAAFVEMSAKTSDLARSLAFAGLAVIWIFKKETDGSMNISHQLVYPALLFVLALGADMLQYLYGTLWSCLVYRYHERKNINTSEDLELKHSSWIVLPQYILFYVKVALVVLAYFGLLLYLNSLLP